MSKARKIIHIVGTILVILGLAGTITATSIYYYLAGQLPSIETLKDVQFQVPLRVYSLDNKLLAEFGEMKRTPVKLSDVPDQMIKAVLAAEDDRFFSHHGVDYQGILRAAWFLATTGHKSQGGSTITMQVARNFFLSSEKTFLRKIKEILLAFKIERELTKEEILELYLNQIYLGNRAYGFMAAANVYYGSDLADLTLAQTAMIAGLPKAPSRYNPIADPERAITRRNYVLGRMLTVGFIDKKTYEKALKETDIARLHGLPVEAEAPYLAEAVRADMVGRFGEAAYTSGLRVYTTIDSRLQAAANMALRSALLAYDRRHGYRGVDGHVNLASDESKLNCFKALQSRNYIGNLIPAVVTGIEDQTITVCVKKGTTHRIEWDGLSWASRYISENKKGASPNKASDILKTGDLIWIERFTDGSMKLAQPPVVEGAIVSIRPHDGAVLAMSGGFDFYRSKFNRVLQAIRQPGSSFKPFVYSSALEKGFTAATLINDAPLVFDDAGLESAWRPENYSGKFYGPTRFREALVHSRNLVSIRILQSLGIDYVIDYVSRFGFDKSTLPRNLSLSLGTGAETPYSMATAYAIFANGGYRVYPYYIDRVVDRNGQILMRANPVSACPNCEGADVVHTEVLPQNIDILRPVPDGNVTTMQINPAKRTVSPQNVYLMTSMMRDVIRRGTARRAMSLGRNDLAGKTGTTNEQRDAWFSGFNSAIVTTTWLGFDNARPMGNLETGGAAALPMWMSFMRAALQGIPEEPFEQPPGLVTVRIDPESGLLASSSDSSAIFEIFLAGTAPSQHVQRSAGDKKSGSKETMTTPSQLF